MLAGVLWFTYLVNVGFGVYGASVINAYMADEMGMNKSTLGGGFTAFGICEGLASLVSAYLINRYGLRVAMALGSSILTGAAILMALLVQNGWQYLLVFGIIMGLGMGLVIAVRHIPNLK